VDGELKLEEPVVIRGNERLRPGQPVQVVQNPAAGGSKDKRDQ
jgi:hypothetical protein